MWLSVSRELSPDRVPNGYPTVNEPSSLLWLREQLPRQQDWR